VYKTKKKGIFMLYEGLKLKVIENGRAFAVIVINKVIKNDTNFIAKDDSDAEAVTEFKFLEKTNAWHVVFEGLGGEHCVKEEIPYTLCPM
jgi:hypothetical protein